MLNAANKINRHIKLLTEHRKEVGKDWDILQARNIRKQLA